MQRLALAPLAMAVCVTLPLGQALAQARPQGQWPVHGGTAPTSFFANGYAQPFTASSSIGMSGVSVTVSPQGGVGVNIVNLGASQSLAGFGRGYAPPGVMAGLTGVPGFSGGSLFSALGMSGLSVQVGGGAPGPGGVSINIANIALNNSFFFGGALARGHYQPRGHYHGARPPRPSQPDGGNGGGGDGGGGGGGDGGGDGGGGY